MEKNYKNLKIEELDFSKSKDGLIPAVIQDDVTLKVLMLGYMNRESLEKTLQSGKVTFYSQPQQGNSLDKGGDKRQLYGGCGYL